ncbi:hypothetical protein DSM104299_00545 [Baekduia alba]|uniref:hypothetical protein n=1 Tax=Baekduia alba TaxID=2997333 RepID=UPI0023402F8B|nr:hypothetical protein [Baekduia alba]WCB91867.1 hypothetical protein DSM104299_00545 [Baekduia alba]
MSPVATTPAIKDDKLVELLALLEDADSVELKMSVADAQQRSAIVALGLDPLEAQVRLVHFFDTPDLTLEKAGVVVRARRIQGKGDDTVVKLRPVVPNELPERLRRLREFVVEVDAMHTGYVCSGSLKGLARQPVRESLAAGAPLRKLFTKEQRAYFDAHAPDGVTFDDLVQLGPIFVLKIKGTPQGFDRKLVVELWLYPDGARILELSTKCLPPEAFQVAAVLRGFLAERGIEPARGQSTKTRKALSFFSAALAD